MHWEHAVLSKAIRQVEKRSPAEVFTKPKTNRGEPCNLLHDHPVYPAPYPEGERQWRGGVEGADCWEPSKIPLPFDSKKKEGSLPKGTEGNLWSWE